MMLSPVCWRTFRVMSESSSTVENALLAVLQAPTPATLSHLHAALLLAEWSQDAPVWAVLDQFYRFLNEIAAKTSARDYSHFASLLDIGAVGGVALQNLLSGKGEGNLWQRVLAAGLSESMMVLAARQYVKAWEEETSVLISQAAWDLYRQLWLISTTLRPELTGEQRRQSIDALLAPLYDERSTAAAKALLTGRLYQLLLLLYVTNRNS